MLVKLIIEYNFHKNVLLTQSTCHIRKSKDGFLCDKIDKVCVCVCVCVGVCVCGCVWGGDLGAKRCKSQIYRKSLVRNILTHFNSMLFPLKSENLWFSDAFRGINRILERMS